MLNNITIGSDPELFIVNTETNKVVSSVGLIPGTKDKPYKKGLKKGFAIEKDNILAEFNIPPVNNVDDFINNMNYMKNYIDSFVKKINPNLGILCSSSEEVDLDQLQSDEAKEFGCDKDYNVYTNSENPKPKGESTNIRSCGLHIHLGYEKKNIDTSLCLVKLMDWYLGIPSLFIDKDVRRRNLYGKAGCFRLQPWGVEYRVLGGYLLKNDDYLKFIYQQIQYMLYNLNSDIFITDNLVINTINNNNLELAKLLIKKNNLLNPIFRCAELQEL